MRRTDRATGVLIVVVAVTAGAVLAACGSSSSHATTPTSSTVGAPRLIISATTRPPSTTTKPVNPVAADQLTQLELTAALKGAQSLFDGNGGDYTAVTPERLTPLVPGTRFGPLDQASTAVVGLLTQDRHDVFMVTRSASGRWYCVTANDPDGVSYGAGLTFDSVNSNGDCQAAAWPPPGTGTAS